MLPVSNQCTLAPRPANIWGFICSILLLSSTSTSACTRYSGSPDHTNENSEKCRAGCTSEVGVHPCFSPLIRRPWQPYMVGHRTKAGSPERVVLQSQSFYPLEYAARKEKTICDHLRINQVAICMRTNPLLLNQHRPVETHVRRMP